MGAARDTAFSASYRDGQILVALGELQYPDFPHLLPHSLPRSGDHPNRQRAQTRQPIQHHTHDFRLQRIHVADIKIGIDPWIALPATRAMRTGS